MTDDDQSTTRRKGNRKWLLRGITIALALVPFALIEIAVRLLVPVSTADPLVDLQQLRPLFVLDQSARRWTIPPSRGNFFRPDSFLADKPPGARRIFVLGGSTVQGRPYAIETAFSTWLELSLQAAAPERRWDVVNCGGVSYASYRLLPILQEVLAYEPDLIVLYCGHNEFLEERTYASFRSRPGWARSAARSGTSRGAPRGATEG